MASEEINPESVSHYVENYRFEFEDGRAYTPTDQDKALLEDALLGFLARQPEFHMPGWPAMRYHGAAKTDGSIWWWEETMPDGSIRRHALQPVMRAAENAAKVVDTWSASKRQYAERVMGGPALTEYDRGDAA